MENYFNRHDAYSRYLALATDRTISPNPAPSAYITAVKLRKALKTITDIELKHLFKKKMSTENLLKYRTRLIRKIDRLLLWQYLVALELLYIEGNTIAMAYILRCNNSDREQAYQKTGLA